MVNKKNLLQLVFLILVFGFTLYYVFHGEDFSLLLHYISHANGTFWIWGVFFVVAFICSESVIIYYLMHSVGQKLQLSHCFLYSFVGFFFSCVTPSASGGQPAQLYFMKKDELPLSVSTLVLMIVTITYKLVLVLLGLFILIWHPAFLMKHLSPVIGWMVLGIILNIICVGAMFLIVFHPTLATSMIDGAVHILQKLHLVSEKNKLPTRVKASMDRYQQVAGYFWQHKHVVLNVFLISVLQRFFLFFITYLTYRSFGLQGTSLWTIVLLQGMISVAVDMLPLPGGMGISEKLFRDIFYAIFGAVTLPAMVVCRGLSYYTQLLISAVVTGVAYNVIVRHKDQVVESEGDKE